jgi:hypothetical protein
MFSSEFSAKCTLHTNWQCGGLDLCFQQPWVSRLVATLTTVGYVVPQPTPRPHFDTTPSVRRPNLDQMYR